MLQIIQSKLSPANAWREKIQYYDAITSTNDVLKELAAQGAPHGTVLVAGHQTAGRGRRGRSFLSPSGVGIYLSVLLRPNCKPSELMHLTCAAACAMCDAVEAAAGFRPGIKWTNDLVYNKKKLSGILTELGFKPDGSVDYAIIGVGVNCCQKPEDFDPQIRDIAGSLSMVTGKEIDRAQVAASMIDAFARMDGRLLSEHARIIEEYKADCITLGKPICAAKGDLVRYGTALDIDPDGALIVRFDSGEVEAVNSGEVSVRGMYGYI